MLSLSNLNAKAFALSSALHVLVFALLGNVQFTNLTKTSPPIKEQIVLARLITLPAGDELTQPKSLATASESPKRSASMAAPPPPTADDWAFAAQYTNRNSKGYRHSWGQQVRSMMGTAVEGPDQGLVRFRIEIAPDGTLTKLETLWSTSPVAEKLARKAIASLPKLPGTPTGKTLIFEKTIAFSPFAFNDVPSYRDDCLPDPPAFRNPFVWDGTSPQTREEPPVATKLDPKEMEECLRQLPKDSIDAEMAKDRRAMEQWGWGKDTK